MEADGNVIVTVLTSVVKIYLVWQWEFRVSASCSWMVQYVGVKPDTLIRTSR
jgi:hypothetical protein